MRQITIDEITWKIELTPEHLPVWGNAIASGDDELDSKYESGILNRLNSGDTWAWCMVRVSGEWNGIERDDYLGCCTYENEQDFRENSGYFAAIQAEIRGQIQASAEVIAESMNVPASV